MPAPDTALQTAQPLPGPPPSPHTPPQPGRRRRGWRVAKQALTLLFFVLLAGLLLRQARSIDWAAVSGALGNYSWPTLAGAAGLTVVSHMLVACYELIGRHLTGHRVAPRRVAVIGAVSYAFNLNLGALVGGLALRSRLYVHAGLPLARVGQVIALSIITNWLGYLVLAGSLFVWQPLAIPQGWRIDADALRWLGMAMLAVAALYLCACTLAPRRRWHWHGHSVTTPSARMAWLQLLVSALNWLTIAAVVWMVLERQIDFASVAAVFLIAAVAGVLTHVPGNLGVLEAVFIALLSHRMPAEQLLAGLIVFRALYYLLPLALAAVLLWQLERGRRNAHKSELKRQPAATPAA